MINRAFIEDLIYGRKRSLLISPVFYFISIIYGAAVRFRNAIYDSGLKTGRKLPLPVISVGNITLGGTGKTPAVINIAGLLQRNKRYPVIISRGYGRARESETVIVSDGKSAPADAGSGGDETRLMGFKLPGVPVVAGSERYKAGISAIHDFNPDVILLDDGYQHRRLQRDVNIALVDASDPFGNGRLFPAGVLREPASSLRRADVVLITRTDFAADLERLMAFVREMTGAPIFTSRHEPVDCIDIQTGDARPLSALRGAYVAAFSGIARPGTFYSTLRMLGANVRDEITFPDHYVFTRTDLAAIRRRAAGEGASLIITTEKDGVKLSTLDPHGIWALRIELKIIESKEWEELLLHRT